MSAVMDKRFEVSLSFNVRELKDGEETPWFEGSVEYHDMPMEGVLALESGLAELTSDLVKDGMDRAVVRGTGDQGMIKRLRGRMDGAEGTRGPHDPQSERGR